MKIYRYLIGVLVFGFAILVHELGHGAIAKMLDMRVPVVSLGYGKRLVGFQWRGTEFRISSIPLGGYTEIPDIEIDFSPKGERLPSHRAKGEIVLVLVGGILGNIIAGYLAFSALCVLKLWRENEMTLRMFFRALATGGQIAVMTSALLITFPFKRIKKKGKRKPDEKQASISGPLGIIMNTAEDAEQGIPYALSFGILCVTFAVFNLLPIPPLDGGKLAITAVEGFAGRDVNIGMYVIITLAGIGVLAGVFFVGLWNDLKSIFRKIFSRSSTA